jgi:hypothetical protein
MYSLNGRTKRAWRRKDKTSKAVAEKNTASMFTKAIVADTF